MCTADIARVAQERGALAVPEPRRITARDRCTLEKEDERVVMNRVHIGLTWDEVKEPSDPRALCQNGNTSRGWIAK
jgi:hypothetical protein